jgi:arylsulfatase A-like enzyme
MKNLILVICDTFRRDHLGCYGNPTVRTPNLDRLAEEAVVFDRAYSGSFPTLPCRAELFTGRFVFPYLNWGPLPAGEVVLSETLAAAGFTTCMVTDNFPLSKLDYGYDRGFHNRIRIRGQWYDNYQPLPDGQAAAAVVDGRTDARVAQYHANVAGRRTEEDYFAPRVFSAATRWLEENAKRSRFFLYVDGFDAHEPWDPPSHYEKSYEPDYDGERLIYPTYGSASRYSEAELRHMRALYAGEVTMVDTWLGKFLAAVDALGLRDDTALVFLSDHGIFLGERGLLGKMGGKRESLKGWPLYREVSRIPMMFRVPGLPPGRRACFTHPGDVMPTLLELAGVPAPPTVRARSLGPVLRGQAGGVRDHAVSSWSLRGLSKYRPSTIRTDEWTLCFWRSGVPAELYHRPSDPAESLNVIDRNPGAAADLHRIYTRFLREQETPPANYWPRHFRLPARPEPQGSLLFSEAR